ncbi:MliC family protein [Salinisphaera sp. SPP-AMP-43]|uniref:MliC family protein n=1 Tax=Salinisphaera sp. SPP-AMP-43 TaxID=3121288 RepID=UPI003C6DBFEE
MRVRSSLIVLTGILASAGLVACAPDTLPPPEGSAASASPTAGGPIEESAKPNDPYSEAASSDRPVVHYDCDDGEAITVQYPGADHAQVSYQGTTYAMHIAMSADGARYIGDEYEWWTRGTGKGADATLFDHQDDGLTGDVITTCHES